DRTAVREQRELVRLALVDERGAHHERVDLDLAVAAQAARDRLEVDAFRVALLAQLHGVAAAERRRARAEAAVEILELAVLAARAVALLVRGRDLELLEHVAPEVER